MGMQRARRTSVTVGQIFGRWTILGFAEHDSYGNLIVSVRCSCGTKREIKLGTLKNGRSQSCGCLARELAKERRSRLTHGMANTPEYGAYIQAKTRCRDDASLKDWPNYAGRGIEFRFKSFEAWYAALGPKPDGDYSVNRINNNGHYEPGNVEWADRLSQSRNRRSSFAKGRKPTQRRVALAA